MPPTKQIMKVGAVVLGAAIIAIGWLHFGIYQGREWGDFHFFRKHRPSSTFYFSSPLGEGDWPAGGPNPKQAKQEAEYVEFVERHSKQNYPPKNRPNP
jgi:hypothetical protein